MLMLVSRKQQHSLLKNVVSKSLVSWQIADDVSSDFDGFSLEVAWMNSM